MKKQTKRQTRFRGIGRHAEELGVRREHLWQVLTGRRQSRSLMDRYAEIKRRETA
jgi:hypothetical protein